MTPAIAWMLSILLTVAITGLYHTIQHDREVEGWQRETNALRNRIAYLESLPRMSVTCACGRMPAGPQTATGSPESCERALRGEPMP